jgi:hypothetical protein
MELAKRLDGTYPVEIVVVRKRVVLQNQFLELGKGYPVWLEVTRERTPVLIALIDGKRLEICRDRRQPGLTKMCRKCTQFDSREVVIWSVFVVLLDHTNMQFLQVTHDRSELPRSDEVNVFIILEVDDSQLADSSVIT